MKFYYKDILVRTSENHHYTHAIIVENEQGGITRVYACCSNERLAISRYNSEQNYHRRERDFLKELLKARTEGKDKFYFKGNIKFTKEYKKWTDESLQEDIAIYERIIEDYYRTAKIVELEERA